MRVAANLPIADAKLTFTFPAWKEGAVESATYRLPIRKWAVKPSSEHIKEMALPEGYSVRGMLNDKKTLFITSHEKGHGLFFDAETGKTKNGRQLAKGVEFSGFQTAPDGRTIAYGENHWNRKTDDLGGVLVLWDVATSKQVAKFEQKPRRVSLPVAFSTDGKSLFCTEVWRIGGERKDNWEFVAWSLPTGRTERRPVPAHAHIVASPNRKLLALAAYEYSGSDTSTKIELQDFETGKPLGELPSAMGGYYNFEFTPDGKHLIGAGYERTIVVWDVAGKRVVRKLIHEDTEGIHSIAESPDSKLLAVSLGGSGNANKLPGTIAVWNLQDGKRLTTLHGHTGAVWSVHFLGDRRLISNGFNEKLRFWNLERLDQAAK